MATQAGNAPVSSSSYPMPQKKDLEQYEIRMHRKNAEIAEDEVDASDIAAIRDDFVGGDPNFKEDMASMKGKAQEQGTAQPELKSTAHDIKEDMMAKHPELGANRAS